MTALRLILQQSTAFAETTWVQGRFDRPVTFHQQPDDVRLGLYGPLATQVPDASGTLALGNADWNLVSMLPQTLGDPWEALGSDHNSGLLWFGPAEAMVPVMARIEAAVLERLKTLTVDLDDGYFDVPVWLSWSFADGTRLLLVYTDIEYQDFQLETVRAAGVLHAPWGAHTDDLLLQEFLTAVARPLLAQRGFPVPTVDGDGEDDEDGGDLGEALDVFFVGDRAARTGDAPLLLEATRHVFCDLMGWDGVPPATALVEEDAPDHNPNDHAVAQTVQRWHAQQASAQAVPLASGAQTVGLRFTQGTSDKVYLVEMAAENGGFVVRTHNGRRGGKLKPKLQTPAPLPLAEADALYQALVRAKVKDGYTLEATTTTMA